MLEHCLKGKSARKDSSSLVDTDVASYAVAFYLRTSNHQIDTGAVSLSTMLNNRCNQHGHAASIDGGLHV